MTFLNGPFFIVIFFKDLSLLCIFLALKPGLNNMIEVWHEIIDQFAILFQPLLLDGGFYAVTLQDQLRNNHIFFVVCKF